MTTNSLIEQIRAQLAAMTDEQRLDTLSRIAAGYCRHCGTDETPLRGFCQCNNDE